MYAFIGDLHLGAKLPQMDYFNSLDKFLEIIKNKLPKHPSRTSRRSGLDL